MKTCSKCKASKELAEFNKNKKEKSGYRSECRYCQSMRNAKYRASARGKKNISDYAKNNKEVIRQKSKDWYYGNIEKAKLTRSEYRAEHKEETRLASTKWAKNNPDRKAELAAKHYANNLSLYKKRAREWGKANPEVIRNASHRRRARKVDTQVNPFTKEQLASIYSDSCFACGATEKITLEHFIPLARGGAHTFENATSLCLSCNASKGSMLYEEWKNSNRPRALQVFGKDQELAA